MNKPLSATLSAVVLWILAGCAQVGPNYQAPATKMPEHWKSREVFPRPDVSRSTDLADWWRQFDDPLLSDFVERAIKNNRDLKKAWAGVKQAKYQQRVTRASLGPQVGANGGAEVFRAGEVDGREVSTQESYSGGLEASWEVDLFGGNSRAYEAAKADYEASVEDFRDVMVSLVAEVAENYVQVRTDQNRLESARKNLELQKETLKLTELKFDTGLIGALDVEQAKYNLEATLSNIPTYESDREKAQNRLSVLLGGRPEDLILKLAVPGPIPPSRLDLAIGIPADLLRRRPDVRAAERRLAAETARIGEAEAELFPKLNLSGNLGYDALVLSGLISPATLTVGAASAVSWTFFNSGAVRNAIKVQNAVQEQALNEYEAAVLTSVEEVENALIALAKETERGRSLARAVEASRLAAELALREYESGMSDFEQVLETQKSLVSFEDQLAESQGQAALGLIGVYKALGGGWEASTRPGKNADRET